MVDYNIFSKIQPFEYFGLAWSKNNKEINSPNICLMINRLNFLTFYFITLLINLNDMKKRVLYIKYLIQLGKKKFIIIINKIL
jgi:hypothetical protein